MIDELKILQEILGDMSGVGLWLAGGFLFLKLAQMAAIFGSLVFIVTKFIGFLTLGLSRPEILELQEKANSNQGAINKETEELNIIIRKERAAAEVDIDAYKSDILILKKANQAEINELKNMYKILKEKGGI